MMKHNHKKTIVLTAGGTGGHVYPADALAAELEKRGCEVMLFTDSRGFMNYKGKLAQIPNRKICSGSVVGKSLMTKLVSLLKVGLGVSQALYYLLVKRPDCVVGFGGYASFPTAIAAIILRIPLIIHEQNAVMSRTNRILAPFASVIAESFANTQKIPNSAKTVLTGMPIRENIAILHGKDKKFTGDSLNILVLGGSQGAKVFADVVPEAVKLLPESEQEKIHIWQQCRKDDEKTILEKYRHTKAAVTVKSFFENIAEVYQKTDVIISRAGASSVYEIAAVGIPAVLVPLPIAADNHQFYNAKSFDDAVILLNQSDFNPEKICDFMRDTIASASKLQRMSAKLKNKAIIDAAERLANTVEKICEGK